MLPQKPIFDHDCYSLTDFLGPPLGLKSFQCIDFLGYLIMKTKDNKRTNEFLLKLELIIIQSSKCVNLLSPINNY
jgi:hypothetical protein